MRKIFVITVGLTVGAGCVTIEESGGNQVLEANLNQLRAEHADHAGNASAHHVSADNAYGQIDSGSMGIWIGGAKRGLGKVHAASGYWGGYLERYYVSDASGTAVTYPFGTVQFKYMTGASDPFPTLWKNEKPAEFEEAAAAWFNDPPKLLGATKYLTVRQHYDPGGWPKYVDDSEWEHIKITECKGVPGYEKWVADIYRKHEPAPTTANGAHSTMAELYVLNFTTAGAGDTPPLTPPGSCAGGDGTLDHELSTGTVKMWDPAPGADSIRARLQGSYYATFPEARRASSFVEYW